MSLAAQATALKTDIVTETQSLAVVKNLLRSSISEICYLRNIFDDSCFQEKNYAGITINAIQASRNPATGELVSSNPDAQQLIRWLEDGVFEALEKKFLRGIVFAIYTSSDECEEKQLIESYTYKITYPNSNEYGVEWSSNNQSLYLSSDAIKNQAIILIRTLITMCNTLNPLPDERYLTMKLYYYDELTPPDYQPKYFKEMMQSGDIPSTFAQDPLCIHIGQVDSSYHHMSLTVKTNDSMIQPNKEENPDDAIHQKIEEKINQETTPQGENPEQNDTKNQDEDNVLNNGNSGGINLDEHQNSIPISTNLPNDFESNNSKYQLLFKIYKQELNKMTISKIKDIIKCDTEKAKSLYKELEKDGYLGEYSYLGKEIIYSDDNILKIRQIENWLTISNENQKNAINNIIHENNNNNQTNEEDDVIIKSGRGAKKKSVVESIRQNKRIRVK